MNDIQKNNKQKTAAKDNANKQKDYWDSTTGTISATYPQLGQATFRGYLEKIILGLVFSFIPAFVFFLVSGGNFYKIWGLATLLISGIYFLAGGCSDVSKTSARKSRKRHSEQFKFRQSKASEYKFELGLFQFGQLHEDIGAAISLLAISVLITNLSL